MNKGAVGYTTVTPIVPAESPTGGNTHLGSQEEEVRRPAATNHTFMESPTGGYTHLGSQTLKHNLNVLGLDIMKVETVIIIIKG